MLSSNPTANLHLSTSSIPIFHQRVLVLGDLNSTSEHLNFLRLKMPDHITSETLLSNIVETITDNIQKQTSGSSHNDNMPEIVTSQLNRLFGRQKSIHHVLGGGKSADVLLWRNKKTSSGVLGGATVIWVLFEWLSYHLLTILCFLLVLAMLAQFAWYNASGVLGRSPSEVPRIQLPDELFVNLGVSLGSQINKALGFLQDTACSGGLKQFLLVVAGLWVAAVIGTWCNFLTVIYIGFVAAHTLPVLYEKYEDEVDGFMDNLLKQFQQHYRKIPTQRFMGRKRD